jgi:predicted dinucleotide-binding enzyme
VNQVTIPDSTVAIIGAGNIGSTLAANFAAGGQDFLLAGRDLEAARKLADKVIVDPSNPVGPDGEGGHRKVIGEQESSGQILAGLLPAGARSGTTRPPTPGTRTR